MARDRIGIWFVGAKGGVASTATLGLIALKKGLVDAAGLVSALPAFAHLDLADWDQWVVGGHDIREASLTSEVARLHAESRVFDEQVLARAKLDLEKVDQRVRPGTLVNVGSTIADLASSSVRNCEESPREAVGRIQDDLTSFVRSEKLDRLVVLNAASTEPPVTASDWPKQWPQLEKLLDKPGKCPLPASTLYAIAALDLGYPYVNFTPSLGSLPEAVDDLARRRQTCHMGNDGKTGETLLKSVLAPMFAHRNLPVMSWVGHNIFGNLDGRVLTDPENKSTKVFSKDRLLGQILGYAPQTLVSIEYIASMGDWKTAWDHVHFKGFLGTPMTLQFIWQGCDSLLAAPLVLDLARFTERAHRAGETGQLKFLSSFFKSPLGVAENDFARQFQMLESWAEAVA